MSRLTKEEKITLKSYEKNAKAWSDAHLSRGYWGEEIQTFHKFLPKGKLLEIGCGGGRDARELIELGYDYLGTDISTGLLDEARKNNTKAQFIQSSVYDLNFDEPFDGFWCAAVLLHIPRARIDEALQAIKKNLKPGGVGFIAVKEGDGAKIEESGDAEGGARYFVLYKNDEFKKVLARNNFIILHEAYRPMSERTKWLTYIVRRAK